VAGAVLPAGIYVFDCIEFSLPFRCNDVASEVAFLTMDLEARGRRDLAGAFLAAYVDAADDPVVPRLVPYYAAFRACVRAMVAALTSAEPEVEAAERARARERAAAYVALALRSAWRAGEPAAIVCCGRSGTGKSTIAAALAEVTDAAVVRSDVIRKRDDRPGVAVPADRYGAPARAAVYAALCREVDAGLAAGRTVIADATFLRRADRDAVAAVAARRGRPILFVETTATTDTVRERLAARTAADVSDARFETYLAQAGAADPWAPEEPRVTVATDDEERRVRGAALHALFTWRADGR
jgi:predicted kinase